MSIIVTLDSDSSKKAIGKSPIIKPIHKKFISSTGTRKILLSFEYDKTSEGKKILAGSQYITDYSDTNARYFTYLKNRKNEVIIIKKQQTILTKIDVYGEVEYTRKKEVIIESTFEVKKYKIKFPLTDWELFEKEELVFKDQKIIGNDRDYKEISIAETREDYQMWVNEVSAFTDKALYDGETSLSVAQAFNDKVSSPIDSIGTASTLVGGVTAFWFTKAPPVVAAIGSAASLIGFATLIILWSISGIEPDDLVFQLMDKDYKKAPMSVYRNHIGNPNSINNTPHWGIKN